MRTILLASLALVTITGCSGAPPSSGDADDATVRPSQLGTESYSFTARTFGYLEPTGYPYYTVDIQGGGEYGWLETNWTNFYGSPPNQMFTIGSNHSILNEAGSCLDIPNSTDENHTPIYANGCNGQANQAWYFYSATMTTLGKCVDVPGGNETPGTNVQVYTCNGGANQRWWLYYDSLEQNETPDAFEIQDVTRDRCLSTNGNGQVVLEECIGNVYETWMHGANGSFWNILSGQCLTASSSNDGTHLTASTCTGSTNQQFTITGELRTGIDSSMCLDVEGGTSGPGVALQIFLCNGGANQFFTMYQ